MREYALVILNSEDKIIDRMNLDLITAPSGNGFKLNLNTIDGDVEDIITKVVQEKQSIKMTINFYYHAYEKSRILTNWIQKYSKSEYKMCLEYNDGKSGIQYCEGKVINLTKTELDEYKGLSQQLEFKQITPLFYKIENEIHIQVSSVGKSYSYKYPYCYGNNLVENNEIENPYILDIPITITIKGAINNPTIDLLDENNSRYARVKFTGVTVDQGYSLIINSAQRKIILRNDATGGETDYAPEIDPSFDTFLRAKSGKSTISVNTSDSGAGFVLKGGWRQYTL